MKENWLALYLAIFKHCSVEKALGTMGVHKNVESVRDFSKRKKRAKILSISDKENIAKLYWQDKLTTREIANKYNTSLTTLLDYMKDNNIPRRNKREAKILAKRGREYATA